MFAKKTTNQTPQKICCTTSGTSASIASVAISGISSVTEEPGYQDDFNKEAFSPKNLVGREEELMTLMKAFERVKKTKQSENVFVRGESGLGKTSLVLALRETVFRCKGFFCMGKYFTRSEFGQEPYSAIMAAFSDLCDLVLQSINEERKTEIQEALEPNGQLLGRLVTNISPFLKNDPNFEMFETKNESALAKFKAACKTFLQAIASDEHPVVLFLDDVQWMDHGSMQIIELFLQAKDMKNLMIIMASRSEEGGYFVESVINNNRIKKAITSISLSNLGSDSVEKMVSSCLGFDSQSVCHLAKLIAHKTQGNPFHVLEFLESIKRERFLSISGDSLIIDMESIQTEMMISDSLAQLLSQKVQRINKQMQKILKVASLIGYRFPENLVIDVTSKLLAEGDCNFTLSDNLQMQLKKAVDERFLERIHDGYQFSHDKIQATFQLLMDTKEKGRIHQIIGCQFLSSPNKNYKYQAAFHLNRAWESEEESLNDTVDYYIEMARINFEASKYCEERSAFVDSVSFLKRGLEFLNENENEKWSINFDLAFEMTESLAKMEFVVGNLDACKITNREVLFRAKSAEKEINSLALEIEVGIACRDLDGKTSKKVLKELDIHIPRVVTPWLLFRKLRKVRKIIDKKTDEEILNIPISTDSKISTGTRLLNLVCGNSWVRKKVILGAYATVLAAEASVKDGLSPFSSLAICQMSLVEEMLGNSDRAYRLAELSLKLIEKFPCKGDGCVVHVNATLLSMYRKNILQDCLTQIPKKLDDAFEVGDAIHVGYSVSLFIFFRFSISEHLQLLEGYIRGIHRELSFFGGSFSLMCIQPTMQMVLNLRNELEDSDDLIILTGEAMNDEDFLKQCVEEDAYLIMRLICMMFICLIFGRYKEAEEAGCELLRTNHPLVAKTYAATPINFIFGLVMYKRYDVTKERRYIRRARKCKKFLVREEASGNLNARLLSSVLKAEELSLKSSDVLDIRKAYDAAIEILATENMPLYEAIANEYAARIFIKHGYSTEARQYFDRAKDLYKNKWGATAVYKYLVDSGDFDEI